jgi:hypothetical protein
MLGMLRASIAAFSPVVKTRNPAASMPASGSPAKSTSLP